MRVLILGVSGMLGHKLFQHLKGAGHEVVGTLRDARERSRLARLPLFSGDNLVWEVDALDWPRLSSVIQTHRPEVIVNALGIIKQRSLAKVATPSIQINALLPHQLADTVAAWNGRLIHFSTDCVFSGSRGGYREDDISDAEDLYGKSKFLGEVSELPNALTLRTSIIGRELSHHQSLLDWVLAQNHRELQGYARVIYSGLTTIEMATVVERVIRQHPQLHGLYQVASSPISKHQLLQLIAAAYQLDVRIHAVDTPVNDRSLNGDRFAADTGYAAPSWAAMIATLAADPTPYPEWLSLMRDQSAS